MRVRRSRVDASAGHELMGEFDSQMRQCAITVATVLTDITAGKRMHGMKRTLWIYGICLLAFAFCPASASPQPPFGRPPGLPSTIPDRPLLGQPSDRASEGDASRPVFRTRVEFVEVPVIATDRQGNVAGDLECDDFLLLDEGKPQSIRAFAKIDIPLSAPARGAVVPIVGGATSPDDVTTSTLGAQTRLYVLVLDDLHVSSEHTVRVRLAARQFVEHFTSPADLLAVVMPGARKDLLLGFTSDRQSVLAAIDSFAGQKLRSATYERYLDKRPGGGAALREGRDPSDAERAYRARVSMATLADTTRMLAVLRGRRKSILYFSEGIDYNVADIMGRIQRYASEVTRSMVSAVSAATRGNVTVYAIDPRGLAPAGDEATEMPLYEERQVTDLAEPGRRGEFLQSITNLRDLAESTGGFAATDQNEFGAAFERIERENSCYYVLGFEPSGSIRSGTYRRLHVQVKRPGILVNARRGYLVGHEQPAPPPRVANVSPSLLPLLGQPLPDSGLGIRLQAIPFKGLASKTTVHLVVEVEGRDLLFPPSGSRFAETIELAILTVDSHGHAGNGRQTKLALKLTREELERARATGVRWLAALDLAPGRYQVRAAANAVASARRGLAIAEIDVPDYAGAGPALSGIALTSLPAVLAITSGSAPPLARLGAPPSAARQFVIGDRITSAFHVYAGRAANESLTIVAQVEAVGHDVASLPRMTTSAAAVSEPDRGQEIAFEFDTALLPPGRYVLRVSVQAVSSHDVDASRTVPFLLAASR